MLKRDAMLALKKSIFFKKLARTHNTSTSVYGQSLASNKRCRVRCQKSDRRGHLFCGAYSAHGVRSLAVFQKGLVFFILHSRSLVNLCNNLFKKILLFHCDPKSYKIGFRLFKKTVGATTTSRVVHAKFEQNLTTLKFEYLK